MRRYVIYVIIMMMALLMGGCKSEPAAMESDSSNPKVEKTFELESIVCTPDADREATCECETFFEDEYYSYSFGYPISQYVIVTYTDGSTENVKEALKNEHITISDLDTHGISYYADPEHIHRILDETLIGEYVAENVREEFYRDEEYIYYFPTKKSEHVMVWYWEAPKQNIKEALSQGNIRITDLDYYGVEYYKEEIVTD